MYCIAPGGHEQFQAGKFTDHVGCLACYLSINASIIVYGFQDLSHQATKDLLHGPPRLPTGLDHAYLDLW